MNDHNDNHWLTRPESIKKLWWIFSGILALTLLAQFAFPSKGYFKVDAWFGFGAIYGFVCCLLMVVFAKLLGKVLKRPEDYYEQSDAESLHQTGQEAPAKKGPHENKEELT